MSYHNVKTLDPLYSKNSNRNDRYNQMTKQQQMIEEKKRQIQEKLEQQKKKESEEALKNASTNEPKPERKPLVFSNDGSFLDQFKKISGMAGNYFDPS